MQKVYVQNKDGEPLMPTTRCGAVRRWLRDSKAIVVQLCPFTIRLDWNCKTNKQEVIVSIDTGAVNVGCSAVAENKVLYASETRLRTNINKKMKRRSDYRRNRRSRKCRYRKPRFDNRRRQQGWLPPSLKSKAESTVKIVKSLSKILPISKVRVEIAKFDTQKLQNPDIQGEEYQNGVCKDFDNVKAYVLYRDNYTCQICGEQFGRLRTHHIIQRIDGGSDRPDNLATVHHQCHINYHKGLIEHKFKKPKEYKQTTQVTVLKNYVVKELKKDFKVEVTFGHITRRNRLRLGLSKTHYNDAIAICNPDKIKPVRHYYKKRCAPRGRYQQTKGKRSEKKLPSGNVFGYSVGDKVQLPNKQIGFVKGRRLRGTFVISNIEGKPIKELNYKKLNLIKYARGEVAIPHTAKAVCTLAT